MKNTTKHVGVVAAVLTAAGITGACPGTAFADGATSHVPANGSTIGTFTQHRGSDHDGDDSRRSVVRGRARRVDGLHTRVSESQTGTVRSVTAGNIAVTGAGGTTWTWTTDTATTVHIPGGRGTLADLEAGDRIMIRGLRNGTVRLAESVVALGRTEMFAAPRHAAIHQWEERADHCEHAAGRHERGRHCKHPASSHGRHRGGSHRL